MTLIAVDDAIRAIVSRLDGGFLQVFDGRGAGADALRRLSSSRRRQRPYPDGRRDRVRRRILRP
jgi:hypothetical protein